MTSIDPTPYQPPQQHQPIDWYEHPAEDIQHFISLRGDQLNAILYSHDPETAVMFQNESIGHLLHVMTFSPVVRMWRDGQLHVDFSRLDGIPSVVSDLLEVGLLMLPDLPIETQHAFRHALVNPTADPQIDLDPAPATPAATPVAATPAPAPTPASAAPVNNTPAPAANPNPAPVAQIVATPVATNTNGAQPAPANRPWRSKFGIKHGLTHLLHWADGQ
ncbi:MAG TPA: hypothetical protein VLI92_03640 [Candidatus Saccharimonadales bacterium]|nr:hypothetical protein [Candidatus Saccharimonadales bacterium]